MLMTTAAFVLRTTRYGDSSFIVHLFTERAGMVSAVARRSAGQRGRRGGTHLLQPLSVLDVVLDVQPSRPLAYVREASCRQAYVRVPFDPVRTSVVLFLAEFLNHVLSGEGENRALFAFLTEALQWLDAQERGIANFHLVFLFRLSLFLGIRPLTEDYREGRYFDLQESRFVDVLPLHPDVLPAVESAHFYRLLRMRFETMHLFVFSRTERNTVVELLLRYYRLHIPSLPELKSLPILQELFR
jgi:DNA repair protein RecO (recombination protein O)